MNPELADTARVARRPSVIVYEPSALVAEATALVITRRTPCRVDAAVSTYTDAFEHLRRASPAAFVFSCPWHHPRAAASFIDGLRQAFPTVALVLVTGRTDRAFLGAALRAGVHAVVHRRESTLQISSALAAVCDGQLYRSPIVMQAIVRRRRPRRVAPAAVAPACEADPDRRAPAE